MDYDTVAQLAAMAHCDMREVLRKVNPEVSEHRAIVLQMHLAVPVWCRIVIPLINYAATSLLAMHYRALSCTNMHK